AAEPEAGDRAIDGPRGRVVGPDAQARCDARAKGLEHDVGPREQRVRERRILRQAADHGFLARVQRVVPLPCGLAHRVATRLLDANDACTEAAELTRRERSGQVSREVDDERPPKRLHPGRTYHYPATALSERATVAEEKR